MTPDGHEGFACSGNLCAEIARTNGEQRCKASHKAEAKLPARLALWKGEGRKKAVGPLAAQHMAHGPALRQGCGLLGHDKAGG